MSLVDRLLGIPFSDAYSWESKILFGAIEKSARLMFTCCQISMWPTRRNLIHSMLSTYGARGARTQLTNREILR
jgi:hypothetical protein